MDNLELQLKMEQLVRQLLARTKNHEIHWTDTGNPDAFRTQFSGGMIRVQKNTAHDEEGTGQEYDVYSLTLLDKRGRELEEYYPDPLAPEDALSNLWTLARRSARGTIDVLDQLLKETQSAQ